MRFVDLSAPITATPPELPDAAAHRHRVLRPRRGRRRRSRRCSASRRALLRDGEGWAVETFTRFGTHNSTHVDAPWHYNSTIGGRARPQTIDELPLEWFHAPGVVLDFTAKADGDAIDAPTTSRRRSSGSATSWRRCDIVLVRTGRDAFYDEPDYMVRGPGVTAEATRWLYERGVRVMGIDAWGWDAPLHLQAEEALARGEPGIFWAAHQADLAVLADRAPVQPRPRCRRRLHGELLPAAHRRGERRSPRGRLASSRTELSLHRTASQAGGGGRRVGRHARRRALRDRACWPPAVAAAVAVLALVAGRPASSAAGAGAAGGLRAGRRAHADRAVDRARRSRRARRARWAGAGGGFAGRSVQRAVLAQRRATSRGVAASARSRARSPGTARRSPCRAPGDYAIRFESVNHRADGVGRRAPASRATPAPTCRSRPARAWRAGRARARRARRLARPGGDEAPTAGIAPGSTSAASTAR